MTDGPVDGVRDVDADAVELDDEPIDAERLDVEVPPLLEGVRTDRAVSMLTGLTRATASALVAAGEVTVDGVVVAKGSLPLLAGQRLTAGLPVVATAALAPDPGVEFGVLAVDPAFVVVDKPPGLVVHPGAGHREGTLVSGLLARFPDLESM
ncbi:MAG TPA: hypothetical protein VKT18_03135, partial [Acidimicrobiales bacterium]|nr:hypothetical protein [Acidimicrobiales bacterium]